MTTLEQAHFNGPIPLHGRLVREVVRDRPVPRTDGTLGPAWELHLHAEWGCVVVRDQGQTALVPLFWVRSMTLARDDVRAKRPVADEAPPDPPVVEDMLRAHASRGRARTKRLEFVRE